MKIILTLLVFAQSFAWAQQSIALFSNKKDSVDYSNVQAAIQTQLKLEGNRVNTSLDSLFSILAELRSKIIGYKIIYQPNAAFTPFDDLKEHKVPSNEITKLSLSGGLIRKIPSTVYQCKNLDAIELVNTSIKKLPRKLSKKLPVKSIFVYNNNTAGKLKLARNSTTTKLAFRGIESSKLPGTYKNVRSLEELDLNANINVSKLPEISRNKKLKKLSLVGNQITLTDLPKRPSALEELYLMRNKISEVPAAIAAFPGLKKLNFSNNPITTVDPAIGLLANLEELSFYNCQLKELTPGLEKLTNLKQIDLYFNQLTKLNIKLSSLKSLQVLYLSNNSLTSLPEDIGSIPSLQELYVSNNKLSYFPDSFSQLTDLRVLRMNNNYFSTFPYVLIGLKNLENLDLSRNDMQQIPDELTTFERLQIFALVGNPWERKDDVLRIADLLRARGTIVHLNTLEQALDDN